MEGTIEDEVVDIESASDGSINDDSDDEGSLPSEIDDKLNLEVSRGYVSFRFSLLFFLNILMIKFSILV